MRWWFSASDHQVKIVLLSKFDHRLQQIIIERWEEDTQTRPGATTTRRAAASGAVQPVLRQRKARRRGSSGRGLHRAVCSWLLMAMGLCARRDMSDFETTHFHKKTMCRMASNET
ncbi:hypothetical protein V8C44DRAFT_343695 [Trichoderma aethiopicum]